MAGVVMLSVSRTESIQTLRLHAWGTDPQLSMPMAQRYFFFIQNIGAYHLVGAPLVSFVRVRLVAHANLVRLTAHTHTTCEV